MRVDSAALGSYRAMLAHAPASKEALEGQRRVLRKLEESRTGVYEWTSLHEPALSDDGKVSKLDVGDYVGPIRVKEAAERGGGRGVFATRKIQAGELLSLEKAFAVGAVDPRRSIISVNFVTKLWELGGHVNLVSAVIDKLMDDGTLPVMSLYAGEAMPAPHTFPSSTAPNLEVDATLAIDTARIESLISYNA